MGVREGRRPPACGGPTGEARGGGADRRRACGPNPAPCSDPKKQHRSQLHPFADEKRCACPAAAGRPPAAGPRAKPVAAARSAAGPAARIRPPYEPCSRPQKSRTAVTGSCPPDAAVRFSKAIMRFSAFSAPQRRPRPPAWGAAAPPAGWRPPRQKLR